MDQHPLGIKHSDHEPMGRFHFKISTMTSPVFYTVASDPKTLVIAKVLWLENHAFRISCFQNISHVPHHPEAVYIIEDWGDIGSNSKCWSNVLQKSVYILSYHSVFTATSSISGIHGCRVRVKRGSSIWQLHATEQVCFLFLWFMLCWLTGLSFIRKHASTMRHSNESMQGGQLLAYFWLLLLLSHQVKKSYSILSLIWTSNKNWRRSLGHSGCTVQSHITLWWGYVLRTVIRQSHCIWAPSSILP